MTRLLKHFELEFPKKADLFDKVMVGMRRWGTAAGEGKLEALYKRVNPAGQTGWHDNEFFSSEAVKGCFDASDLRQVEQFGESVKKSEHGSTSFEFKLVSFHRECAKREAGGRAKRPKFKRLPMPSHGVSQEEAQAFLPPGARLSRDVPNGRWLVVWKPFGSISRSWSFWGEIPSLAKVLKWAWEHYTRMEGHSCPHKWVAAAEWKNA